MLFLLSSDGFMFRQMNGCPIKPSHIYAHPVLIWFLNNVPSFLGSKEEGHARCQKSTLRQSSRDRMGGEAKQGGLNENQRRRVNDFK